MASNINSTGFHSLRYPSWCLSRMLDKIIGTEEEVAYRRKCYCMKMYVIDVYRHGKLFFSGSKAEGFNFQTSDYDLMLIDTDILVTDNIQNTEETDDHKTVLVMTRNKCNPGFVILQLRNRTNNRFITESLDEYQNSTVVSSLRYRDVHRVRELGQVGHGPCNTFNDHGDIDVVNGFECKQWPSEASEFIHRSRPYGWPQKMLLDKIIRRGCHLVPIGEKQNALSNLQWRLSFIAAEKDLVHSFTHTQFRVYGALKIFLKQVINKIKPVEDLLCSYFLKMVLFYSIESTPASFWREDMLIPCFWFCVNKLSKHVEEGFLPNYFVRQNNTFRDKMSGKNQQNLLFVFNQVKCIGWSCIYLSEDFRSLQTFVRFPESVLASNFILNKRQQECRLDITTMFAITDAYPIPRETVMTSVLSRVFTTVRYARSQREWDISMLNMYLTLSSVSQFFFCISFSCNNKDKYKLLEKCEQFLLASSKTDMSSGYLATFHYQTEQYSKAVQDCQRLIARWKPFVLFGSRVQHMAFNVNMYKQHVCDRQLPCLEKARTAWAIDVAILPKYKQFYPSELHCDIEANVPFTLFIPPLPYAVFLLFLCHHKLGNIEESVAAVNQLKILVKDELQGLSDYPIVLNLLAICLGKVGDRFGATCACAMSRSLKPEKNGADRLLNKIFREDCETVVSLPDISDLKI